MTNKQVLNKLLKLVEYIEQDTFRGENDRIAVINGVEYRISDFRNFKRVIEWCKDIYSNNINSSANYIEEHIEYHRILSNMRYYKRKKHKTPKDFTKMEELQKRLDKVKEKRDLKKKQKKLEDELAYKRSIDDSIITQELEKEMEIRL